MDELIEICFLTTRQDDVFCCESDFPLIQFSSLRIIFMYRKIMSSHHPCWQKAITEEYIEGRTATKKNLLHTVFKPIPRTLENVFMPSKNIHEPRA